MGNWIQERDKELRTAYDTLEKAISKYNDEITFRQLQVSCDVVNSREAEVFLKYARLVSYLYQQGKSNNISGALENLLSSINEKTTDPKEDQEVDITFRSDDRRFWNNYEARDYFYTRARQAGLTEDEMPHEGTVYSWQRKEHDKGYLPGKIINTKLKKVARVKSMKLMDKKLKAILNRR